MTIRYYRRHLGTRDRDVGCIVYAVQEKPPAERTDPVRVVAGFPAGWRPTPNPGEALADRHAPATVWMCEEPRKGFRHYQEISEAEALALYPGIAAGTTRQANW